MCILVSAPRRVVRAVARVCPTVDVGQVTTTVVVSNALLWRQFAIADENSNGWVSREELQHWLHAALTLGIVPDAYLSHVDEFGVNSPSDAEAVLALIPVEVLADTILKYGSVDNRPLPLLNRRARTIGTRSWACEYERHLSLCTVALLSMSCF